jgi:hypothetical protein
MAKNAFGRRFLFGKKTRIFEAFTVTGANSP